MKAIIPVAGAGERLRPFTHTIPKPLLPVAGKPILAHIIESLLPHGIDEIIFVVGYMGEKIEHFVREKYQFKCSFVWQDTLLGLGYAIFLALQHVQDDEPVLIILGDTIIEADMSQILASKNHTLGIVHVDDPRRFGVVQLSGNRIIDMEEKPEYPKSNWAIAGVYFFANVHALRKNLSHLVEHDIRHKNEIQLTSALSQMLAAEEIFESAIIESWFDCGKPETILSTNRTLLKKGAPCANLPGSIIIPPVSVAPTAIVENSIIGPFVSLGERVRVQNSILRDSIVGDMSVLKNCILEKSILGNDSTFFGMPYKLNLGDSSKVDLEWET